MSIRLPQGHDSLLLVWACICLPHNFEEESRHDPDVEQEEESLFVESLLHLPAAPRESDNTAVAVGTGMLDDATEYTANISREEERS